jgi:hypothetical protein
MPIVRGVNKVLYRTNNNYSVKNKNNLVFAVT